MLDDQPYWTLTAEEALRAAGSASTGLTGAEASARLRRDGPNTVRDAAETGALRLLWRQFESPLVLILVFGSLVALALRDWTEASIILTIVLGSTALGFGQEYHASRAVAALRGRLALRARVLRDGAERTIPASEIVPGDVIVLSAGNLIPADGLILEARDFLVSEASLTGESFPVEKSVGVAAADAVLARRTNCVFAGASVRSGTARALIAATGRNTTFGAVAARLAAREPETEFSRELRRFGALLVRVMVLLVLFVLTVNQLLHRPFLESLLFSVALAVGMSPELLPAIVSVTLASGARAMAKRGVLVRRLEAIENLGGIDILCTDKTGTLTAGAVALQDALDADGKASTDIMRLAHINAALETGIANPLDEAIVAACKSKGLTLDGVRKRDEIPYDFQRKRLTIVVEEAGEALIVTKGAFDQMMDICTEVAVSNGAKPMAEERARLEALYQKMGEQGLRVLALATRSTPLRQHYAREDEAGMTFRGFLTFLDPPKPDAGATVTALSKAGVRVKIITGDNRHVAAHVAERLGLGECVILRGEEIDAIKGDAFGPIAERTDLFVEVDPAQKERIVRALQHRGHSVGFLGDGVNDAPALHAADVGVSVDQAVDVAREAADIILLERDLSVLKQGIEDGRRTFANTTKYISITTGSSFGNMISMAIATPLLPFLPLTAAQVLLTNFLTDLPLIMVSTDNVDPEAVAGAQRLRVRDVQAWMLVFGLLSSVFDIATFTMLAFVFHADAPTFQTTWFVVSVCTEIVALLVLRTRRRAWKSRPSRWIAYLSLAALAIAIAAPFLDGVSRALDLIPLPLTMAPLMVSIVVAYGLATEAAKAIMFRNQHGK